MDDDANKPSPPPPPEDDHLILSRTNEEIEMTQELDARNPRNRDDTGNDQGARGGRAA